MEYLAFGLLGLGAIFILIGILSARTVKTAQVVEKPILSHEKNETRKNITDLQPQQVSTTEHEYFQNPASTGMPISPISQLATTPPLNINHPTAIKSIHPPLTSTGIPEKVLPDSQIKPLAQRAPSEPNSQKAENLDKKERHEIKKFSETKAGKAKEPVLFFKENATLYADRGRNNVYESSRVNFQLLNTENIHRIGPGKISFDGFQIYFDNKSVHETIHLDQIDRLNFHSNCFIITKKQSGLASIFFIDNTERIKAVLENHKMLHVTQ